VLIVLTLHVGEQLTSSTASENFFSHLYAFLYLIIGLNLLSSADRGLIYYLCWQLATVTPNPQCRIVATQELDHSFMTETVAES
jgi:hypothetical protein